MSIYIFWLFVKGDLLPTEIWSRINDYFWSGGGEH